jgi:hypothetical protein
MDNYISNDNNNPINWKGNNKECSECSEVLTLHDYETICNNCYNKEEEEETKTEYTCCNVEITEEIRDNNLCPICLEHI